MNCYASMYSLYAYTFFHDVDIIFIYKESKDDHNRELILKEPSQLSHKQKGPVISKACDESVGPLLAAELQCESKSHKRMSCESAGQSRHGFAACAYGSDQI